MLYVIMLTRAKLNPFFVWKCSTYCIIPILFPNYCILSARNFSCASKGLIN